jgi:hypothetical protein
MVENDGPARPVFSMIRSTAALKAVSIAKSALSSKYASLACRFIGGREERIRISALDELPGRLLLADGQRCQEARVDGEAKMLAAAAVALNIDPATGQADDFAIVQDRATR